MAIPFTQYLLPNGRTRQTSIARPEEVETKARAVIEAGLRFECEMLSDYRTISLTVSNGEEDIAIEVVQNGPDVPPAVDRLVDSAFTQLRTER